jgi:serine/threonine protein kinase
VYHGSVARPLQLPALLRVAVLLLGMLLLTGCSSEVGPGTTTLTQMMVAPAPGGATPSCLPEGAEPVAVTLPAHLDGLIPRSACDYALTATLTLGPAQRGKPLTLAFPSLLANAELYVDGEAATRLDPSPLDVYRPYSPLRYRLPAKLSQRAELRIELRVHHVWLRSAWIDAPAQLAVGAGGDQDSAKVLVWGLMDRVLAVFAIATALVVLLLYGFTALVVRGPRRHTYALFAIGGACGLAYPCTTAGFAQALFGIYDVPVMAVTVIIGAVTAMHFSHAYFGMPPPSRVWFVVILIGAALAVVSRSPFACIRVMGPVLVVVTIANTIFQAVLCLRLRRRAERPANLYLVTLAWPATAALGAPDLAAAFGFGERLNGLHTASLGIGVIYLLQAVSLARDHVISLERADTLNAELGARFDALMAKNREVEVLNDELRRQIAARSKALAERLAQSEFAVAVDPPAFEPGDVVDERYRVLRTVGAGGMGAVFEVERIADGKHFALKALATGGDAQAMARFAREAEICANVKHPNVVSIIDVDVARAGYLYLVMELAEGGTTLHNIRRRNRDVPWTMNVLAQVSAGLSAIHRAGVVHRDLKPTNILLSRGEDGRKPIVKITDFGISSLREDNGRSSHSIFAAQKAATASHPHLRRAPLSGNPAAAAGKDSATVAPRSRLGEAATEAVASSPRLSPPQVSSPLLLSSVSSEADDDNGATQRLLVDLDYDPDEEAEGTIPLSVRDVSLGDSKPPDRTPAPRTPLTQTGIIFGTPQYMAPELTSGSKLATRASDIFSVGIIAFELLVGHRPFPVEPVAEALAGKPLPVAPRFSEVCPALTPAIAQMLDRTLSNDPALRPSAQVLYEVLHAESQRMESAS